MSVAEKKKARKEDDKNKKDVRIAAANKMTEKIFAQELTECIKCNAHKGKLERKEKQIDDMKRQINEKEHQLSDRVTRASH